jgi:hypothetical protein
MKTLAFTLALGALLITACNKKECVRNDSPTDQTTPIKTIDGFKNGKPFINYLGAKMEGC